jgi:hypothetical protein
MHNRSVARNIPCRPKCAAASELQDFGVARPFLLYKPCGLLSKYLTVTLVLEWKRSREKPLRRGRSLNTYRKRTWKLNGDEKNIIFSNYRCYTLFKLTSHPNSEGPSSFNLQEIRDAQLKNPRGKIHNLHLLNHSSNTVLECQMCSIFLQIVLPILFIFELHNKSVGNPTLVELRVN